MRLTLSLRSMVAGILLGLTAAPAAQASTLFLDSWAISYGSWSPSGMFMPPIIKSGVEDWTSGGNGCLGPWNGGDPYYALDFDHAGALRSQNPVWENPSIQGSPVWGGVMDPLRVSSWSHADPVTEFRYGSIDGRHAMEAKLDRAIVAPESSYTLHWTMSSGNDGLNVTMTPVPEPTSLLLLGSGLALAGLAFRRRQG